MDFEAEIEKAKQSCESALARGKLLDVNYYYGVIETLGRLQKHQAGDFNAKTDEAYPQAAEENEYRYVDAGWLDRVACGLTAGASKYPGQTWRSIPAEEHAARAIRHLNLYRMGNRKEEHLINASMRCMMAYVTDREQPAEFPAAEKPEEEEQK